MQFIPGTAARFDLRNPHDPTAAIRAAARYVRYLSRTVGNRLDSVLAAYNAGEGTVLAYQQGKPLRIGEKTINAGRQRTVGGVPQYTEIIGYVGRGLKIFRWLESRGTFLEASQKANFPEVISASIESVPLFDLELGAIPPVRMQGPESPAFSELRSLRKNSKTTREIKGKIRPSLTSKSITIRVPATGFY